MLIVGGFEFSHPFREVSLAGQQLTHLHKRANDQDIHLHSPIAAEHRRKHRHAVFSERIRQGPATPAALL